MKTCTLLRVHLPRSAAEQTGRGRAVVVGRASTPPGLSQRPAAGHQTTARVVCDNGVAEPETCSSLMLRMRENLPVGMHDRIVQASSMAIICCGRGMNLDSHLPPPGPPAIRPARQVPGLGSVPCQLLGASHFGNPPPFTMDTLDTCEYRGRCTRRPIQY
ncbi:hypothetical protein PCL_09182 [Purpureocillium lilacinum]|uniref:Uncharacterized protein n=1 Tax=Purpureocillium lilacinum TaxID=33203 RepID=A0A2U3EHA8_PURLI|nr:hypothetical protein PCL_09182 [Purpureocillium lilacinum]